MTSLSSAVWSAIGDSVTNNNTHGGSDTLLHTHLAGALGTLGDAQYWEESIRPQDIRDSLATANASSAASTPVLLKGMKWLLASISKGRDVSDFYVVVVKLVASPVTEVRRQVYTYLIHYANHSAETRELSLLSINSFQRGLTDREPLIRALALRVLTTIHLPDVLPIQLLAVTKHTSDASPYVRKCTAVAMAKLASRVVDGTTTMTTTTTTGTTSSNDQHALLLELVQHLLDHDPTTMVLSSALIAFCELTNGGRVEYLHMLHGSFRKLCHLLTDMDEWGQVECLQVLTRYSRLFFKEPRHYANGSAEQIDAGRRVVRRILEDGTGRVVTTTTTTTTNHVSHGDGSPAEPGSLSSKTPSSGGVPKTPADRALEHGITLPPRKKTVVKRRVVKKGFYSDEEDESTEEEILAETLANPEPKAHIASNDDTHAPVSNIHEEEEDLDEDHRLLLVSAMPLLKSRNSGVVLAVCSLHYYCGVSSIRVRKAMGKALVRIHRARHSEVQSVVLQSIRRLVCECPSAFSPFLHDFFCQPDMDPPFTRLAKLDILTALALDPPSIATVLNELRTYVQLHHGCSGSFATDDNGDGGVEAEDDDVTFVCRAVQAVGKVTELSRIVYDRHGSDRRESDTIALNCLFGLVTLSQTAGHERVVGEAVTVMQRILQLLRSDGRRVYDPNRVQERALRRILLLLVNTLSCLVENEDEAVDEDIDDNVEESSRMEKVAFVLPSASTASALWIVGEHLAVSTSAFGSFGGGPKTRLELERLLVRCFLYLDAAERESAIVFAQKMLVSSPDGKERVLCERILSMGRVDLDTDVRDQARYESTLIQKTIGLQHDQEVLETLSLNSHDGKSLSMEDAKRIISGKKPGQSYLPLEDKKAGPLRGTEESGESTDGIFRFGTLSSLVGHRARSAYLPLPPWAPENSDGLLREPPEEKKADEQKIPNGDFEAKTGEFYRSSSSSSSGDDDDSSSSDSSSSDSSSGAFTSSSSSSSSTNTSSDDDDLLPATEIMAHPMPAKRNNSVHTQRESTVEVESVTDGSSSGGSDSDESSDSGGTQPEIMFPNATTSSSLIPLGNGGVAHKNHSTQAASSALYDLKGLVLAPVVSNADDPTDINHDRDSGNWFQLVRPEHAGGLSVEGRYLRNSTRAQQLKILGFSPDKASMSCLQFRFENQRDASGGSIRHVRILQRSSTSSASTIAPRKIVLPQEIAELPTSRKSECTMGIEFASASDRDGSSVAKLEIKYNGGGIPVELKPTLGDLLQPCKTNMNDFDERTSRMHGFNRVESKITISATVRSELPKRFYGQAALTPVGSKTWMDDKLRFAGTLPASSDPVYVLVRCDATTTTTGGGRQGKVVVCCDHALVVNSIMNLLKRALV